MSSRSRSTSTTLIVGAAEPEADLPLHRVIHRTRCSHAVIPGRACTHMFATVRTAFRGLITLEHLNPGSLECAYSLPIARVQRIQEARRSRELPLVVLFFSD